MFHYSRTILIFCSASILLVASCRTVNSGGETCFRKTKKILKAHVMYKMTDQYLVLRRGNYFEFYKKILGLSKYEEYVGRYVTVNNTLHLYFCSPPPDDVGTKVIIRERTITMIGAKDLSETEMIIRKKWR